MFWLMKSAQKLLSFSYVSGCFLYIFLKIIFKNIIRCIYNVFWSAFSIVCSVFTNTLVPPKPQSIMGWLCYQWHLCSVGFPVCSVAWAESISNSHKMADPDEEVKQPVLPLDSKDFDPIADILLKHQLYLTALELHTELVECGIEIPKLRDFFSNPGNFERQFPLRAPSPGSMRE